MISTDRWERTLFIGHSESYVKEGSTNGHLSLHRSPTMEPEWGLIYGELWEREMMDGSGNSLSVCGSYARVPFWEPWRICKVRHCKWVPLSIRGWGHLLGTAVAQLHSQWHHCEGNLEGGLLYWGFWEICKSRFWKLRFLHRGPVGGP